MPSITWQFSTYDSTYAKLIRWKTNSEISHVDVITPDGMLLGAQRDGVRVRQSNYEDFKLRIQVTIDVTQEQYDKYWQFVNAQIRKPYDWTAIFGIVADRSWQETDSWFCSELHAAGVVAAGILKIDGTLSFISPETLRLLISSLPTAQEKRIA